MKTVIAILALIVGFAAGFLVERNNWHKALEHSKSRRKSVHTKPKSKK